MRHAPPALHHLAALTLLLAAGCPGSGTGGPPAPRDAGVDASIDAAACSMGDTSCDPHCMGIHAPAYCVDDRAPNWSGCGPCKDVGYTCNGFEFGLTCECDHKWHFTYRPDCHSAQLCEPDGGFTCTDGG